MFHFGTHLQGVELEDIRKAEMISNVESTCNTYNVNSTLS